MSDKTKTAANPKTTKSKRCSTATLPSSSRTKLNKDVKNTTIRPKKSDLETTVLNNKEGQGLPEFDAEYCQIAYGKFLRAMLEECVVDEKIKREETILDIQMGQLADRFKKTMDVLDKTNRRLKDINFVVEQKRLLDLKRKDCDQFYETTDNSNTQDLLKNLSATEQTYLNRIELKNVEFGYNKETGHQQLLDAVNDAIEGFEKIKKESNLDPEKILEYENTQRVIEELEKDRFDLDSLQKEFETKFPKFSENLLKDASARIAKMIGDDVDDEVESD